MKVRTILWYRNEEEMFKAPGHLSFNDVLSFRIHEYIEPTGAWECYNCLNIAWEAHTRERFEYSYLNWKERNED